MPIYEFQCSNCDKPFQTYTPAMTWDHVRCPKCGSIKVVKQLSKFAVLASEGDIGSDYGGDSEAASSESGASECSGNPDSCPRCDFDD